MTDIGDAFKAMKQERQREGERNRAQAWEDFPYAATVAAKNGLILKRHGDTHYKLVSRTQPYCIEIYPGNWRLYINKDFPKTPFLKVPDEWILLQVVNAAIEQWRDKA
jgi:hypothetical protein